MDYPRVSVKGNLGQFSLMCPSMTSCSRILGPRRPSALFGLPTLGCLSADLRFAPMFALLIAGRLFREFLFIWE